MSFSKTSCMNVLSHDVRSVFCCAPSQSNTRALGEVSWSPPVLQSKLRPCFSSVMHSCSLSRKPSACSSLLTVGLGLFVQSYHQISIVPTGLYLDWLSLYFYISLGWGKARISAQFLAVSRLVLFLQRWDTFQNKPCTSCLYTLFSCCFLYACSSSWMEHCLTTSSE